jgi:NodT family efflux transporter outer membrane factor (OMF) lipoprotein
MTNVLLIWIMRARAALAESGRSAGSLVLPGVALFAALIGGCASFHGLRPEAALAAPESLKAGRALADATVGEGGWPAGDWWREFRDPQLNALIDEALAGSPSLRVAAARTREALARAGVAGSARFPQLGASFASTRERFSEHGLYPPPFAGSWDTQSDLEATLSWEADVWGRNRNAHLSALDEARATSVDAYAARLALSASVAHAYVQLERAYRQRDVAQATLKQREDIYALTRERNAAGIDSRLEVKQAESALPATRAQIEALDESIELGRDQLAALLGQGPDRGLAITRPAAQALADATLPSRLPAELLGRRPDLIAQRWRIEAASRGISAAKAAFYPNVNLNAFVGLQNLGPGTFLTAANREAGVGPALSLPLFDAGRRRADLAGQDAGYDLAVEQYNQALADALREVADQLVSFRSVAAQRREQQQALATAQDAYDLAVLRYRGGVGNYLQVLTTETQRLAQQSLEVELHARALDLSINLVRALGGGFAERAPPASLPGS